ncbi:unnamed protein product [Paramecium sonneborni]|uniref:Uncharacterized protein n=1 Tax=Paramecium sonneborni TaxID=65129 RepID=A0A8S1KCK1_9CILI|nr:unnamed protein product [Paramecium sonneborni]
MRKDCNILLLKIYTIIHNYTKIIRHQTNNFNIIHLDQTIQNQMTQIQNIKNQKINKKDNVLVLVMVVVEKIQQRLKNQLHHNQKNNNIFLILIKLMNQIRPQNNILLQILNLNVYIHSHFYLKYINKSNVVTQIKLIIQKLLNQIYMIQNLWIINLRNKFIDKIKSNKFQYPSNIILQPKINRQKQYREPICKKYLSKQSTKIEEGEQKKINVEQISQIEKEKTLKSKLHQRSFSNQNKTSNQVEQNKSNIRYVEQKKLQIKANKGVKDNYNKFFDLLKNKKQQKNNIKKNKNKIVTKLEDQEIENKVKYQIDQTFQIEQNSK